MRQCKNTSEPKKVEQIEMNDSLLFEVREKSTQNPNRRLEVEEKEENSGRRSEKAKECTDLQRTEKQEVLLSVKSRSGLTRTKLY